MVFFDNASTTKICNDALDCVISYSKDSFYNPSALYNPSMQVSNDISNARQIILKALGANSSDRFIFTSGATEANNTIIRSVARNKNAKYLFSMGEHPSVYNVALDLQSSGYNVEFIKLNRQGTIDLKDLNQKLDENTAFVSIMHVNNETGAINDVKTITQIIKSKSNALVHCDGVQAFLKIPVNVINLGVDFYSISGHKFHGPKGVGGFYVRNGVNIKPFIIGGGQESSFRSGTENVPAIIGMSKAVQYMLPRVKDNLAKVTELSAYLHNEANIFAYCPSLDSASPYINIISISGVRAETLLHMLEDRGYLVGNGSACSSKHRDNRVLSAIGLDSKEVEGSIRISFCDDNTIDEVKSFIETLKDCVQLYKSNTNGGSL